MDGQSSACHPLQAHLVLESHFPFRLILYWIRLTLPFWNPPCYHPNRHPCALRKGWINEKGSTAQNWKCSVRQTTQDVELSMVGIRQTAVQADRSSKRVSNQGCGLECCTVLLARRRRAANGKSKARRK